MKNKIITYILLIAVFLIWGYVFYKAIEPVSALEQVDPQVTNEHKMPALKEELMPDTFSLYANYRDPFLANSFVEPKVDSVKINRVEAIVKMPVPQIDWSFIRYSGRIQNAKSKQSVALVSIRGKDYMMAEGKSINGVKLIENLKDSIKISYEGKIKFIRLN